MTVLSPGAGGAAPSRWWEVPDTEDVTVAELASDPQLRAVAAGRIQLARSGRVRSSPSASRGTGVAIVQRAFLDLGLSLSRYGSDGDYGTETERAARAFQRSAGLHPDGIVGALTLAALTRAVAARGPRRPPAPTANPIAGHWRRTLRLGLSGNTVAPLVDGPATFAAMRRVIGSARTGQHFVYLLGWWCDPWIHLDGPGTSLLDLFGRAGGSGVQVRGLLWASSALAYPNHARLATTAVDAINRLPNCHFQVDDPGIGAFAKSHHQKMLVVRGERGLVAMVGGVDVNADRVHAIPPPSGSFRSDRPADLGWEGGSGGSGSGGPAGAGSPLHDVHATLTGPTALPLQRAFIRRWWARSGDRTIDRTAPLRGGWHDALPAPTGRQFVRIGETFEGTLEPPGGRPRASRVVAAQDIWLRSILGAHHSIYWEEQYLTHPCAAEAINDVLPRLDHVIILIPPSEITDFPGRWEARQDFLRRAGAGPHGSKLRVYTPVSALAGCVRTRGRHLYVHSKTAVIDDAVTIIGSANCNHRGWETDSEIVVAAVDEQDSSMSTARRLRMQLWSEHLGVPAAAVRDAAAAKGLWDVAPGRRVCRYAPAGGSDPWSDAPKTWLADPEDSRPGDPCRTLLTGARTRATAGGV
ncbi:peptidoglycan-binding protein [Demequina rhizosphaerae]|uniref:peptidoglycan-binding protein n=1 Tax=Demequina rhizosphaerae TaxID=1638985 RepID=UPI0009E64871|nr:peptidoglycan-binding protein [Demequina rhizosphaerae]